MGGSIIEWLLYSCPVAVLPLSLKLGTVIVSGLGTWVGFLLGESCVGKDKVTSGLTYIFLTLIGSMWLLSYLSTNYCILFP